MNDLSRRRPLRSLLLAAALSALGAGRATADTIAAGQDFAGAIDSGGVLRTWGKNASGQLGLGSTTSSVSQPMPVSGIWKHVAMGQDFTLAISTADELWAWGNNTSGQLGTGGTASSSSPVRVSTSNFPAGSVVRAVAAGQNFAVALVDAPGDAGRIYAWGDNSLGQLGQGDTTARSTPALVNAATRRYSAITATRFETAVAIATDGSLYAWGANTNGECAQNNPSTLSYTTPTRIGKQIGWTAVAGGLLHVLALRGNELYGWGANSSGQAGVPPTVTVISGIPFSIPVSTVTAPTRIAASQTWAAIGAGQLHSLAVDSAGALYGWGSNQLGQLALNITNTGADLYTSPQLIGAALAPWAAATGGLKFTVARTAAGAFYTVGGNDLGQLGNGTVDSNLNTTPSFGAASLGGVNLSVTAPSLPATTLGVNTVAQPVSVTVQNTGGGSLTSSFVVQLYLSSDSVLDPTDRLVATSTQSPPLASLGSRVVTFTSPDVAIPEVTPGAYSLISQASLVGAASAVSPAIGAATSVTVSAPDLTVENLAVAGSHTVLASGSFSGTTATIRNGGTGAVAAGRTLTVRAYLGTTTTHNAAADTLVDSFTYTFASGLASGASVTLPARDILVPAGSVGGSYQLLYTINDEHGVDIVETGTLTDAAALAVAIQSHDLAASAPSLPNVATPADLGAKILGANATLDLVNVSALNVGTQAFAAGFTVSLYLSADSALSADDRLLASVTDGASLAANSSRLEQFANVAVPNVAPGVYFLLARIDPSPGNNDAGPSNNTAAIAVRVKGPDFTLTNAVLANGSSVSAGGTLTGVSYTLRNQNVGVLPASSPLLVQVWLSSSASFSPTTAIALLDQYSLTSGLGTGPSAVALPSPARNLTIPAGTPGGSYNLFFVVNGDAAVAESGAADADPGTANNVLSAALTVGSADLAVTAPQTVTTSLGVNTTVGSVSAFVQNTGTLAITAGYTVELYLSADNAFSADDIHLQTLTQSAPLNAVSSIGLTWTNVGVPDVTPGDYFLLARVAPLTGTDGNLANNVTATSVTLVGPTLGLGNFVFPNTSSVAAGGTFGNVSYQLGNTGLGAVPAGRNVTVQVYLSSTATYAGGVLVDQYSYIGGLASGASVILPSPAHAIGLPQNIANGIYNLFFVVSDGTTTSAGTPTSATVTGQSVSIGALDASVTAPALSSTSLGVNTPLPSTAVTVANNGGFAIPAGTVVSLYLSTDSQIDLGDTLLASQTITATISAQTSRAVTFANLVVPDVGQGAFHLLAQAVLPAGLIDISTANNVSDTAVNLQRPKLALGSVNVAATADLDSLPTPSFSAVTFSLDNSLLGAVPAGTSVLLEVYLSSDPSLNISTDTLLLSSSYSGGLGASGSGTSSAAIPAFNLPLDPNTVGGTYYLIFAANRDRNVQENDTVVATATRQVFLQKTNAPGLALDYGTFTLSSTAGGAAQWFSVTDTRASDSTAFQSPSLSSGQTATLTLTVSGPTTINAPWLIIGSTDTVSYAIDGVTPADLTNSSLTVGETYQILSYVSGDSFTNVGAPSNVTGATFTATGTTPTVWTNGSVLSAAKLTGFAPSYKPKLITISTSGSHTISWTYAQGSTSTASFARLDLDIPTFSASGDGSWFGATDATAPNGGALKVARSPALAAGQQAALSVTASGPAVVSFWWRADTVTGSDTLGFYVDGSLQSLPTATFSAAASPAVITGSTSWANVAFLIGSGPHALSWVYAQGSTTTTSAAYVDGLQVITPVPVTNSVNQVTNNATHPDVPVSNLDLAVTEVIAPTGTYLLDDANGTGRLPVTITVTNLGYDFDGTTLTPSWDPADLEIHLSTNRTFGDSDDIDLGSFAALDTLDFGDEAVFDGEINLPFDIPGGDYFLLVRYAGSAGQTEFTYANNTQILGPGYVIQRAPDLVINSFSGLASNNPYHPEDSVFVRYTIGNTSLGTVLTTQPFKVTIELMALGTSGTDLTTGTVIKSYNPATYSLFLPEVGGQYPNGGSSTVTHFLDLPSLRDTLAKLGFVTATTPEDDGTVSAKAFNLSSFNFYFRITVDSGNAIAESSETNTFYVGNLFSLTAVPASLNVGEYFGQSIFSTLTNSTGGTSIGASTAAVTFTGSSAYASLVKNYALGVGLAGAPQTLFQPTTQNGYPSLTVPPGGTGTYLTETFDFNIRANDVQIDVQASADPTFATGVTTLLSLTPPYGGTSGNHSLSGFGGLKDNPFVLAVDGNNTSVQETYVARVTVRDSAPTASFSSRFMRLNITPASGVSPPSAPPISAAGYSASSGGIVFFFSSAPASGAYVIERSVSASSTFNVIGTSTSTSFLDAASSDTYNYRLRTVNSAGASTTTTAGPFTVP